MIDKVQEETKSRSGITALFTFALLILLTSCMKSFSALLKHLKNLFVSLKNVIQNNNYYNNKRGKRKKVFDRMGGERLLREKAK